MKKFKYILLGFIFCLACTAQAQFTLQGQVRSLKTGEPIAGADVFDEQSKKLRQTDEKGNFKFENLEAGWHLITLFAIQWETKKDSIFIDQDMVHNFEMSSLGYTLSGIEVAAKKEELFVIKQLSDIEGTAIYAGKKSEVVVLDLVKGNLANNNSRQVFAQVSGLNIFEGNDGGLQLNIGGRGLEPNRTSNFNTRQNGYDISADVLGYPESYYSPPTEAISEIRILRGASSLQYGTQFGGLIDFKLRKIPSFKKFEFNTRQTIGAFNAFNSFNSLGWNKGKFSLNAFYNYKRGDGYRPNSNYKSNNLFLSLEYEISKRTKIGAEATYFKYLAKQAGGLTDAQFLADPRQSTRDRNWFEVDWKLFNFSLDHQFKNKDQLSLKVFGLNAARRSVGYRGNPVDINANPITAIDEQNANGEYILPRDLIDGAFINHGAELRYLKRYQLGAKRGVFLVGGKYYNSNNATIQGPGSNGADANFELQLDSYRDYANQSQFSFPNLNYSLFAENIFYLSEYFSITPGLRYEYIKTESAGDYNQVIFDIAGNPIANNVLTDNKILKRNFLLFGIGLNFKRSKRFQWVANLSQNYRSVTFSDIRVVSPTFIVDPEIKDERGFTADFGLRGVVDKIFSYEITAYSILYRDRIGIILDDRANRVRKNIGNAIILGSESLANMNIGRWIFEEESPFKLGIFINSALTYSQYLSSEENNVTNNQVEFVPRLNIKSGLNIGYKDFNLSYQFSHISEQYTDAQNSGIALEGDKRHGIIGQIPSYSIMDLTLSAKHKQFTLETGTTNLLNQNYFTRRATGYPGPGIIPSEGRGFFVTLGMKL